MIHCVFSRKLGKTLSGWSYSTTGRFQAANLQSDTQHALVLYLLTVPLLRLHDLKSDDVRRHLVGMVGQQLGR